MSLLVNILQLLHLRIVSLEFNEEKSINFARNESSVDSNEKQEEDEKRFLSEQSDDPNNVMTLDHVKMSLQQENSSLSSIVPSSDQHMHLLKTEAHQVILTNLEVQFFGVTIRIQKAEAHQDGTQAINSLWSIIIQGQVDVFIQDKHIAQLRDSKIQIQTVRAEIGVRIKLDFSIDDFIFTGQNDHLILLRDIFQSWNSALSPEPSSSRSSTNLHSPLGADPAAPMDSLAHFHSSEEDSSKDYIFDENGLLQLRHRPTTLTLECYVEHVRFFVVVDEQFDYGYFVLSQENRHMSASHFLIDMSQFKANVSNTHEAIISNFTFQGLKVNFTSKENASFSLLKSADKDDTTEYNIKTKLRRQAMSGLHFECKTTTPPLTFLWMDASFNLFKQAFRLVTNGGQNTDLNSNPSTSPLPDVTLHQKHLDQMLRKSEPCESHFSVTLSKLCVCFPRTMQDISAQAEQEEKDNSLIFELHEAQLQSDFLVNRSVSEHHVQCEELYAHLAGLEVLHSVNPSISLTMKDRSDQDDIDFDVEVELQYSRMQDSLSLHDIYAQSSTQVSFDTRDLQLKMTSDQFCSFRHTILHSFRTINQSYRTSPRAKYVPLSEQLFEDGSMLPELSLKASVGHMKWRLLNCRSSPRMITHNYIINASNVDLHGFLNFHPNFVVRYSASASGHSGLTLSVCEEKENGEHKHLLRCNKVLQKFKNGRCFSFNFVQSVVPSHANAQSILNLSMKGLLLNHEQHLFGDMWLTNLGTYFNSVGTTSTTENILDWKCKEDYHLKMTDCLVQFCAPQSMEKMLGLCDTVSVSVSTCTNAASTLRFVLDNFRIFVDLHKSVSGDLMDSITKKRGQFGLAEDLVRLQFIEFANSDHLSLSLEYMENASSIVAKETALTVHCSRKTLMHVVSVVRQLIANAPTENNPLLTPPKKAVPANPLTEVLNEFDYALKRAGNAAFEAILSAPSDDSDSARSSVELLPLDTGQIDQGTLLYTETVLNDGVILRCLDTMANHLIQEDFFESKLGERITSGEIRDPLITEYGPSRSRVEVSVASCEVYIYDSDSMDRYFKSEGTGLQFTMMLSPKKDEQVDWVLSLEVKQHSLYDSLELRDHPVICALGTDYTGSKCAFKCLLVSSEREYGPSMRVQIDISPIRINLHQYHIDMLANVLAFDENSTSDNFWDKQNWNMEFAPLSISKVQMKVSYTSSEVKQGLDWTHSFANLVNFKNLDVELQEVDVDVLKGVEQVLENLIAFYAKDISQSAQVFQLALGILPVKSLVNVSKSVGDLFMIPISAYQSTQHSSTVMRGIQQGLFRFMREVAVESTATLSHLSMSSASMLESASSSPAGTPTINPRRERPKSGVEGFQQAAETIRNTVRVFQTNDESGGTPSYMLFFSSPAKALAQVMSGLQASLDDGEESDE